MCDEDALARACDAHDEEQGGQIDVDDEADLAVAGVALECYLDDKSDAALVRIVHDRDDGREGSVVIRSEAPGVDEGEAIVGAALQTDSLSEARARGFSGALMTAASCATFIGTCGGVMWSSSSI